MTGRLVTIFAFALANIFSAAGFAWMGLAILPSSKLYSRGLKAFGIGCFGFSALAHIGLALTVLFNDTATTGWVASRWWVILIQGGLAVSTICFVFGIYLQEGRWTSMPGQELVPPVEPADDITSG